MPRTKTKSAESSASLGFEAKLWLAADKLRNNMDAAGFCMSVTAKAIATHGHVLTPGRHVGAEEVEDDGEPFAEKMARLVAELNRQFTESARLEKAIKANLKGLGYGG